MCNSDCDLSTYSCDSLSVISDNDYPEMQDAMVSLEME